MSDLSKAAWESMLGRHRMEAVYLLRLMRDNDAPHENAVADVNTLEWVDSGDK